jgi:hypothetical protein
MRPGSGRASEGVKSGEIFPRIFFDVGRRSWSWRGCEPAGWDTVPANQAVDG